MSSALDGIPTGGHSAGYLRRFSVLRSNAKPAWTLVASAARELTRNSTVYAFGFPKAAAPIATTGEVVFEMESGQWMIQTRLSQRTCCTAGSQPYNV